MAADFLRNLLARTAARLEECAIPYAIIGGMAVVMRGSLRMTRDVDFLIDAPAESFEQLEQAFRDDGLIFDETVGRKMLGDVELWRFKAPHPEVFIDVIVDIQRAVGEYQRAVVAGAEVDSTMSRPVRRARTEDLILLKLIAFRPIDRGDAVALIAVDLQPLDWEYIEARANELGLRTRLAEVRAEAQ